jgi:methionyl-tRNA formyltransferase
MRILFWGTPPFAATSLKALLGAATAHRGTASASPAAPPDRGGQIEVVGVITQPDRPAGRGRKLRPSPVGELAAAHGIPVLKPEIPRGEAFVDEVRALRPDLSVVVAYGHILRAEILDLPPAGSVNVHASLLPALRGAAPIHWALLRGDAETGVTLMQMTPGMDAGPILLQRAVPIRPDHTQTTLTDELAALGGAVLVEGLRNWDGLLPVPQDPHGVTFAPKVDRELARIPFARDAVAVANHVRAMDAVPGAWTEFEGDVLKLFSPEVLPTSGETAAPGTRIDPPDLSAAPPLVFATGSGGRVAFHEVQPAGRRRMTARDWARGR